MKRILVTGASGQLGLSIQDIHKDYPDFTFVFKNSKELDITNFESVEKTIGSGGYDFVINCAAYTNVEQAEKTPKIAFKVNAEGVKNIALVCKKHGVTLIHISTDYVFDGKKVEPYTVHDIPNPINEYGKSKWEGEKHIQETLTDYFIIRTSWLYSKKYGKNFYKTILERAKKGETLEVTEEQVGRPTDALNLAKFIIENIITNERLFGIHHYSDGQSMSWFQFAQKIIEENGLRGKLQLKALQNYHTLAKRPENSVLD